MNTNTIDQTLTDRHFMQRAIELAKGGLGSVEPNPMVGAVIVSPERHIIGEGFHRRFGEAHAEVNAVNSVREADKDLLKQSTIYVTLEPCSHYGKTPPCSRLLIEKGFRRIVIGTSDPFDKVAGRGIEMLREAGIEVTTGVLQHECRSLNARFFTAHTLHRPFITLKWAQSADGFLDRKRCEGDNAMRFSTTLTSTLSHRLRSHHQAIGIGSGTILADKPLLNVRYWSGTNPEIVVFDRRGRLGKPSGEIEDILAELYERNVTSILIEGGPTLLQSFIDKGLWDLARIETTPIDLGNNGCAKAPSIDGQPFAHRDIGPNTLYYYSNNVLVNNFFIDNGL